MSHFKGDKSKQPPECTVDKDNRCPNLDQTYQGYDSETYRCKTCGEYFKLYYDEMA